MKVSASLPTGVAALFFDSARRRRELEEELVAYLEGAGFSEVILPVVDYFDPYQELVGFGSRQELYRFVDRDGEMLSLRADFTPMLARLIAPRLDTLELPLRFFYRGDVLRYQELSALQREFFQLGAEILETDGERAERAALEGFLELLARGRCGRPLVVLGVAGALDRLLLRHGARGTSAVIRAVGRRERSVARDLGPELLQVVENGLPDDLAVLGDAVAARLARLQALCGELGGRFPGVELRIDLAEFADQPLAAELRQDLGPRAYYDGLVFHAFGTGEGARVGGGGRYDQMFKRLGAEVAAAGFCVSVDLMVGLAEAA